MPALVTNRSTNGTSDGVALDGPCTISIPSNSVFDGAGIAVEYSTDDTNWSPTGLTFYNNAEVKAFDAVGEYFLRTLTFDARTNTSITVHANQ